MEKKLKMNKKGIIFTLDLLLAIMIIFIVLTASIFFISRGSAINLPDHQLQLIGSDIITIMDHQETFDSFNPTTIEESLEQLVPKNYQMAVRVQQGSNTIEANFPLPEDSSIISGMRVALSENDTYMKITYYVWQQ